MRKVLLLLAIGVFTAGCTSLTKLKTPDLKVVGVSFLGGDGHHQQLQLLINVDNPNNKQIAVKAIDYQLSLAGTHVAEGSSAEPFTLPALGQTQFRLNANADLDSLIKVVGAHLNDSTVDYQATGVLHLAEGVLREIPFKGHGQVPLR